MTTRHCSNCNGIFDNISICDHCGFDYCKHCRIKHDMLICYDCGFSYDELQDCECCTDGRKICKECWIKRECVICFTRIRCCDDLLTECTLCSKVSCDTCTCSCIAVCNELCAGCCEMKIVEACNDCGFDYCNVCVYDNEMHQPCSSNSNTKYMKCYICQLTNQLPFLHCLCPNDNHIICNSCMDLKTCKICGVFACNDIPEKCKDENCYQMHCVRCPCKFQ